MIPVPAVKPTSSKAESSEYGAVTLFCVTHVPVNSFWCCTPPHRFIDPVLVMTYLFHEMLLTFTIFKRNQASSDNFFLPSEDSVIKSRILLSTTYSLSVQMKAQRETSAVVKI